MRRLPSEYPERLCGCSLNRFHKRSSRYQPWLGYNQRPFPPVPHGFLTIWRHRSPCNLPPVPRSGGTQTACELNHLSG
uniref:Uncharacterized protein n=1 Tax=Siphoviridae sp. ct3es5 TaxID=2825322 RepID=A0A8S5PTC4_9CAUD|nr:MAG TPA: hypothetical protein [Siphoviridae sp. ct3es5]